MLICMPGILPATIFLSNPPVAIRLGGRKEIVMNIVAVALMLTALLTSFTAPTSTEKKEHVMSQFMLILHETPSDYAGMSVEDMQRIVGEYVAWKQRIEAEGRMTGSNKLADEGGRG